MIVKLSNIYILFAVQFIIYFNSYQCKTITPIKKCNDDEFKCNELQCILKTKICDGKYDCYNKKDETYELCENKTCNIDQFSCSNGACVPLNSVCNLIYDCADDSDEADCDQIPPKCENEWMKACLSGDCITLDQVCDGIKDCPDNSDETYSVCSNFKCPQYSFTCKYGACIDSNLRCNGVPDCLDHSDEIGCGNDTAIVITICGENQFQCNSGLCIKKENLCNGIRDCDDGSDETYRQCKDMICDTRRLRCSYGACNTKFKCVNYEDSEDVEKSEFIPEQPLECYFPHPPANGIVKTSTGIMYNKSDIVPEWTILIFTCNEGFSLGQDQSVIVCMKKLWSNSFPTCKKNCSPLSTKHHEIECFYEEKKIPCDQTYAGTIAKVKCKDSYEIKSFVYQPYNGIRCNRNGTWSAKLYDCNPVCGTLIPKGQPLVIKGYVATKGEFPWHAGLYKREENGSNYEHFCGGTLISENIILTAAHCFWDFHRNKPNIQLDQYAIGVGKIYRDWNSTKDLYAQHCQIKQIILPQKFHAEASNFANDIAIVILNKTLELSPFIRPVCVDWSNLLYKTLFTNGSFGVVAGWGLTQEYGSPSEILKAIQMPYIEYNKCFEEVPEIFRQFITFDKICAGYQNGTSACTGDSGGGFALKKHHRYFIGGVVSLAPAKGTTCDSSQYVTLTSVPKHLNFIMKIERDNQL